MKTSTHGGKRHGAGAKLKGTSKRINKLISFDPLALKLIDEKRGKESRGDFLGKLINKKGES